MNPQFLIQNNSNIDNTFNKVQNLIDNRDYIEENDLEQDNLLPSNPEDWKDTIFSGEGEILASVGETKFETRGNFYFTLSIDLSKLSNEEMILYLQKENKDLKEYLRRILRVFSKFKSKTVIPIKSENIKLPNNTK